MSPSPQADASAQDIPRPAHQPLAAADRAAVLQTAGALFAKHGVKGVTLQMVADAVRRPLAEIQSQFPSEDSLLAACLSYVQVGVYDGAYAVERPRSWASIDAFVGTLEKGMAVPGLYELYSDATVAASEPEHAAHDWLVRHHQEMLDHITVSVATGIEDGEIVKDADATTIYRLVVTLLLGLVPLNRAAAQPFDKAELYKEFRDLLIARYATPEYIAARAAR